MSTWPSPAEAAILVIGGVFALLGFGFWFVSLRSAWRAIVSPTWPVATGRILRSEVTRHYDRSNKHTAYFATIEYCYEFGAQTYNGQRMTPFPTKSQRYPAAANREVAAFPVDAEVPVYVDPWNPRFAILRPGLGHCWTSMLFGLAIGSIICLLGYSAINENLPPGVDLRRPATVMEYIQHHK